MPNPFVKLWKYLTASANAQIDQRADPKIQIEQAIGEAQRQHQELSQQAAAVIGNQRQLEMKLNRQLAEVEKLSEGELDVQVFGADSLVKANDNIMAVAKGDIECAFSLNFQWGKTLPLMNVTVGPYSMSSIEAWKKWPTSDAAKLLEVQDVFERLGFELGECE